MTSDSALLKYWGKADPAYPGEPKWHPLAYHCLDVAAVGVEYLARAPAVRRLTQSDLGGDKHGGRVAYWPAIHDFGKLAQAFQGRCSDVSHV